jgi:hypothetical protein
MANKDGVAHGRTRFNIRGIDLNRNWDKKADGYLAPENMALETWLESQISKGKKPDLAICFHNDAGGNVHLSRPENLNIDQYLSRMEYFEELLREYTWFTEKFTGKNFRNPGTFGEGLLLRYGIDACIHELNANWIGGLNKKPSGSDWKLLGRQYRKVLYEYFKGSDK